MVDPCDRIGPQEESSSLPSNEDVKRFLSSTGLQSQSMLEEESGWWFTMGIFQTDSGK